MYVLLTDWYKEQGGFAVLIKMWAVSESSFHKKAEDCILHHTVYLKYLIESFHIVP